MMLCDLTELWEEMEERSKFTKGLNATLYREDTGEHKTQEEM